MLLLSVACFGAAVSDNDFLLRRWTSEAGLSRGDIRGLARTPDGFLWIAADLGLLRFDGSSFEPVDVPFASNDRISCLQAGRQGLLWAGTEKGRLLVGKNGRFEEVTPSLPAGDFKLTALAEDTNGELWVATSGAGLHWLHNGSWKTFARSNGLPGRVVSAVVCDLDGQVWALAEGKLVVLSGNGFRAPARPVPSSELVTAIAPARGGGLWVSITFANRILGQRLFRHQEGVWTEPAGPYPWSQNSKQSMGEALLEDESGRVWAATAGGGIYYWSPDRGWKILSHQGTALGATVNVFIRDQEGTFWFGARGGQLFRARKREVTLLTPPLQGEIIHSACSSADGSLWLGTYGAGIYHYRDGDWTTYGQAEGLENLHVFTLFEDRHTNLWAGVRGGLYRFANGRFVKVPGISAGAFLTLFEDRAGNLWVGGNNGLGRIKDGSVKLFGRAAGVPSHDIRTIAQDPDGQIWIAVRDGGLFQQEGERFRKVATQSPVDSADIRNLLFDPEGALWIATFGQGLFRMQSGQIRQWRIQDGMPSDYLLTMVEDGNGRYWVSSANGIFGWSKETFARSAANSAASLAGRHLSVAEGLESAACSGWGQPVAARTRDGQLCFPNQSVLAVFDPGADRKSVV